MLPRNASRDMWISCLGGVRRDFLGIRGVKSSGQTLPGGIPGEHVRASAKRRGLGAAARVAAAAPIAAWRPLLPQIGDAARPHLTHHSRQPPQYLARPPIV